MSRCHILKISVVMAIREDTQNWHRSITSLLGQSFTNWELLATDCGGNDKLSAEIMASSRNERRVCALPNNSARRCGSAVTAHSTLQLAQ